MSKGVRLKNATSEPETSALIMSSAPMQMEGIKLPECAGSRAVSSAMNVGLKGVVCVQQGQKL